jgi:hypothetical protein
MLCFAGLLTSLSLAHVLEILTLDTHVELGVAKCVSYELQDCSLYTKN